MSDTNFLTLKPFLSRWRVYVAVFVTALIAEIFLLNTVPLITGEIGTLFVPRHIPEDYLVLKDFILKQPKYFRTLWVPTDSRWGIYTNQHPKVSLVSVIGDKWKPFLDETAFGNSPAENRNRIVDILNHSFSNDLLDSSSIKYVIVPLQDQANDDDFFVHYGMSPSFYLQTLDSLPYLTRIDIGTQEVAVFENEGYRDHVYAEHEMWSLESFNRLDEKRDFLVDTIGSRFQFSVPAEQERSTNLPMSHLTSLFERVTPNSIEVNALHQSFPSNGGRRELFEETTRLNLFATTTTDTLTVYSQPESSITINGTPMPNQQDATTIVNASLKPDRYYFVEIGSVLTPVLNTGTAQYFGFVPSAVTSLDVISTDGVNRVPNGSFEEQLWQETVGDCNAYDDKGLLDMFRSLDSASEGRSSMQLEAVTHIACASTTFAVEEGEYIFSFDHQSPNAKQSGYFIQFQSSTGAVTYSERIPAKSSWQTFSRTVTAPAGTTSVSIFFYAYSVNDQERMINRYDDVKLLALEHDVNVSLKHANRYTQLQLPETKHSDLIFRYQEPNQSLANLISNSSFDDGLWSDTVGDCNAYDDQSELSMFLRNDRDNNYLELSAARHIACTGPGQLPVRELRDYLLSFAYQSPNATEAGYYIGFNDPQGSKVSQRLPVKGADWQTFSLTITVPKGATNASLLVYAYSKDDQTAIINNYDDVVFVELPDVQDRYYVVERPTAQKQLPPHIAWSFVNPTKQIARVSEASGSFFVIMSESFHPSWQAFVRPKGAPDLKWWETLLFRKPGIKIPDSQHIVANGFANGWYISDTDLNKLSNTQINSTNKNCDRNNCPQSNLSYPTSRSVSPSQKNANNNSDRNSITQNIIKRLTYRLAMFLNYQSFSTSNNLVHLSRSGDATQMTQISRSAVLGEQTSGQPDEYEIVLEFWPQRYFYLGLLISGTTLLSCIGYLLWDWRKRKRAIKAQ